MERSSSDLRGGLGKLVMKQFHSVFSFFWRGRKCKPIFVQIARQVVKLNASDLRLPSRAWKVKLVGEGADDAGGVFDDTITEMCQVYSCSVPCWVIYSGGGCFTISSNCSIWHIFINGPRMHLGALHKNHAVNDVKWIIARVCDMMCEDTLLNKYQCLTLYQWLSITL